MMKSSIDREYLEQEVAALIATLDVESEVPATLREGMKEHLLAVADLLASGAVITSGSGGMPLTRHIVDSWPLGNKLGNRISKFEHDYGKWRSLK